MTEGQIPSPGDGVDERIVDAVRERTDVAPVAGVVLGSGLGDAISVAWDRSGSGKPVEIPYADLPGFPATTVPGHAGRLWLGTIGGRPIVFFQGRIHFYEGNPMPLASITSRVAFGLGARTMMLSAATGGVHPSLSGGSMLVVRDHLNLMGANPLAGWRYGDGSPAFVDLSNVYDAELTRTALAILEEHGTPVAEGVYAALPGPSYETPAETEMLRRLGASVVGMSMVPEAVVARALGMRVLGLSCVTNAAGSAVSHEEVLLASKTAAEAIGRVVAGIVHVL
ncbi:MAG TPA: purine-nucleoside phosphorylase [Actinomycetota bacterium]|nr:purine-nucleoside phosphorylase [Actinomycetota bacterium]